jgi:hypothetical protein
MDAVLLAEVMATIKAGFEAVEVWQKYGPSTDAIQTLNLSYNPTEFVQTAIEVAPSIDPYYDGLFADALTRIRGCIDQLRHAINDDDELPGNREKFGKAARKCICREISIIMDFLAGKLPEQLDRYWQAHKCAELREPMYARSS